MCAPGRVRRCLRCTRGHTLLRVCVAFCVVFAVNGVACDAREQGCSPPLLFALPFAPFAAGLRTPHVRACVGAGFYCVVGAMVSLAAHAKGVGGTHLVRCSCILPFHTCAPRHWPYTLSCVALLEWATHTFLCAVNGAAHGGQRGFIKSCPPDPLGPHAPLAAPRTPASAGAHAAFCGVHTAPRTECARTRDTLGAPLDQP